MKSSVQVFVALFPTLLWGEMFTRILLPQNLDSRMNIYMVDPVIGFTYLPGAESFEKGREYNALYQINRVGLRDRDYGPKEKDVFRILLLGDSFSASHGLMIEESLSRQLENALQAAVELDGMVSRIEVVNGAVGGYSPYNYWKAYLRWSPVFRPDMVVVGLSPDDHDCSNEDSRYVIRDGDIMGIFKKGENPKAAWDNSIRSVRKWLSSNSEVYILARNFIYYNDVIGYINRRVKATELNRSELPRFLVPQPESVKNGWAKAFSYLRRLRDDAAKNGAEVVAIPIPSKMEVDPEMYRRVLKASDLKSEQIDLEQPLRKIQEACEREQIAVIDPSAAIRKRHAEAPCYFSYDGHWTAEGIRAGVASIAEQWRKQGVRPWRKAFRAVENRNGEGEMIDARADP